MKVIQSDSGQYAKIYRFLKKSQCKIVLWQMNPETQERRISETRLNSFPGETPYLDFSREKGFAIDVHLPVFFYVEEGQIIFKGQLVNLEDAHFTLEEPSEIKLLDEPDVEKVQRGFGVDIATKWKTKKLILEGPEVYVSHMKLKTFYERSTRDQELLKNEFDYVSLDEEDKMFADKRESVRMRPKVDKMVKVLAAGQAAEYFRLFDLSQGGLAFITTSLENFPKNTEIQVLGFDTYDLDDPLVGVIMSHRPVDESQVEFKVGIKFIEGQSL